VVITEDGDLVLVAASPDQLREMGRAQALDGETWNVPAFADGILLVRNTKEMAAFDLRPEATGSPNPRSSVSARASGYHPVSAPLLKASGLRFERNHAGVAGQTAQAPAQPPPATAVDTSAREYFVSWGYNGDSYTKSDIHFSQPSIGNDFTLVDVKARDSKGWTDGLFSHSLFVPQYNIRFGLFFNEKWGLEVAMDHFKWIVKEDQEVQMTGTMNGSPVDAPIALTEDVLRYQLNNGANPIFFNLVRRVRLAGEAGRTGHISFLAKAGGGFAVPHTENKLFGEPNEKGFQAFHGWNLDAAAAIRAHFYKFLYFEFEDKLLYARYFGVNIDRGEAGHSVKANQFSFHFGAAFR